MHCGWQTTCDSCHIHVVNIAFGQASRCIHCHAEKWCVSAKCNDKSSSNEIAFTVTVIRHVDISVVGYDQSSLLKQGEIRQCLVSWGGSHLNHCSQIKHDSQSHIVIRCWYTNPNERLLLFIYSQTRIQRPPKIPSMYRWLLYTG